MQAPELAFQPSLEQDSPGSFYALVESLLDDVFNFATLVPRVAAHNGMPDYHSDVEEVRERPYSSVKHHSGLTPL